MELLGTHKVSFETIRALAIECHALDLSAYNLLFDSTHQDISGATKEIYEELVTNKLLSLAVAIRTKLYQRINYKTPAFYPHHCGFLYKFKKGEEQQISLTIKDVCDKIIHAESISKNLEKDVKEPIVILSGRDQNKNEWELFVSVSLFSEAVLNWVNEVEET